MMIRRFFYVASVYLLFNALYPLQVFGGDYTPWVPDDPGTASVYEKDIDFYDWQRATGSDATPSNVTPFSAYSDPYDGSISTSVLQYFRDVVEKLPPDVDYVFFRSGQYDYRLVYSDSLELSGTNFSAGNASYISYNNRYSAPVWAAGNEGHFSLTAGSSLVYSSLGDYYPVLLQGVKSYEFKTLLFMLAIGYLFYLCYSWFFIRRTWFN